MKALFIFLLVFACLSCFAQDEGYTRTKIDTLKIINSSQLKAGTLTYKKENQEFYFDKTATLKTIRDIQSQLTQEVLKESRTSGEKSDGLTDYIEQLNKVYGFVQEQESLFLSSPWLDSTITDIEQIENNFSLLTAFLFPEIACELFSSGHFYFEVSGKPQRTIIKAEVTDVGEGSEVTSIKFLLPNGVDFWICGPIIRAHYLPEGFNNENYFAPEGW